MSEALRLAELIERDYHDETLAPRKAAAELRRLHALNAELVEALRGVVAWGDTNKSGVFTLKVNEDGEVMRRIRAALAKAEASK